MTKVQTCSRLLCSAGCSQ